MRDSCVNLRRINAQILSFSSDISLEQLNILKERIRNGSTHPRDAKVSFAKEIITRFHSKEAAEEAHENFDKMFRDKRGTGRY